MEVEVAGVMLCVWSSEEARVGERKGEEQAIHKWFVGCFLIDCSRMFDVYVLITLGFLLLLWFFFLSATFVHWFSKP